MKTIRASEIGAFVYCHRAWWLQKQGVPSQNQAEMVSGTELHQRHGRTVMVAGCVRILAYFLLLAALALAAVYLTGLLL